MVTSVEKGELYFATNWPDSSERRDMAPCLFAVWRNIMGFTIIGTFIAFLLLIPNFILILIPPKGAPDGFRSAGILFTLLERLGQAGCLIILVIFKDNFQKFTINVWLILMILCILLYDALWIRYIIKGQDISLLFSFGAIPIPMALAPICAFGFASVWGMSPWLGIAVAVLAAGHIPNSWHRYRFLTQLQKNTK